MSLALPLDLQPFEPRFPWWGPDLQTLANRLRGVSRSVAPHRSETLSFPLADGSGDTLLASLDHPTQPRPGTPLVVLIHGLTGSQSSLHVCSMARLLLGRGLRVLRLNLRGAGPSRAVCSGHYYAGGSEDLRKMFSLLPNTLTRDGVVAMGYSLGGSILLKYLGEEGAAAPLRAAATVCSPIDLVATGHHMMRLRNRLYQRYIVGRMQEQTTAPGAVLSDAERSAVMAARTVWDYDEYFVAPRHGFAGANDYYERCRPTRFMAGVRVPTLMIAALDDPWIPGASYRRYDWRMNASLTPLLSEHGGHVGFHGTGSADPWSDLAAARFFDHG